MIRLRAGLPGFYSRRRQGLSSSPPRPDRLRASPSPPSNGYRGLFPGVKRQGREAGGSLLSSTEVQNTCVLPWAFMALCFIKHRVNFTFTSLCENFKSCTSLTRWGRRGGQHFLDTCSAYVCVHFLDNASFSEVNVDLLDDRASIPATKWIFLFFPYPVVLVARKTFLFQPVAG
jgi:hypothetical protein